MAKATDKTAITDEFTIELNPVDGGPEAAPQLPAIPDRPDGTDRDAWVEYVVALGASIHFVTSQTNHWDADSNQMLTSPALDTATLIKLADHLGG